VTPAIIKHLRKQVSPRNRWFKRKTGMVFKTFMTHLFKPIDKWYTRMRRDISDGRSLRDSQLKLRFRLYRFCCFLRREPIVALSVETGQDPSTVLRDVNKLAVIVAHVLEPKWVVLPARDSDEYEHLLGNGDFRHFPFVPYAMDLTYMYSVTPDAFPQGHYIAHKKRCGYLVAMIVDGFGVVRLVSDPVPGAWTDGYVLESCGIFTTLNQHMLDGHRVLYDCGLGTGEVRSRLIAPTHSWKRLDKTIDETEFNDKVRYARNLVEHRFGRIKSDFPILDDYPFKKGPIAQIVVCCVCLSNINALIDTPMRWSSPCPKRDAGLDCPFCAANNNN
jgi:hypothetical protein